MEPWTGVSIRAGTALPVARRIVEGTAWVVSFRLIEDPPLAALVTGDGAPLKLLIGFGARLAK